MSPYSVFISITILCYAGLIYVFLSRGWRANPAHQTFSVYLVTMLLWQVAYLMVSVSQTPDRALFWYRVVVAVVSGQFIVYFAFTRNLLHISGVGRMVQVGLGVWALTVVLGVLVDPSAIYTGIHRDAATGLFVPTFGPLMPVFAGPNYLFLGYAVFNLVRAYRDTRSSLQRSRIQYLLLGIVVVIVGLAANFHPDLQGYPIDVLANLINAFIIAYAILRYQLLDISLVIRKGLLYSVPTAIIGAGYFLLLTLAMPLFTRMTDQLAAALFMAGVAAVAAQPLKDAVQSWIDRLFFREKYDATLMLQRLSQTVASVLNLDEVTAMILDAVLTTMHIAKAAFLLRHEQSGEYQLVAQRGFGQVPKLGLRRDHPLVGWLSSHQNALTKYDMGVRPQFKGLWGQEKENLEALGVELLIPLSAKGKLVGILAMGGKLSEQPYTQDDQRTLITLANQTAVTVENARLYDETQRHLQEAELLNRVRASIISTLELDKTLQLVMDSAVEAIPPAQKGSLHLLDLERNRLVMRASLGYGPELVENASFGIGEGWAGWAFAQQEPVIIDNVHTDLRTKPIDLPEFLLQKSSICVPLVAKDRSIGTITLDNLTSYAAFDRDDLELLSAFAAQAAIAIENARLYESARRELAERKRAEKEREALEGQLRQAQKMEAVGLLAGGVAHEFNNMLTVIQGNAELATRQLDPSQPVLKELSIIRRTAQRAAKLTGQLLAFSRHQVLQRGKVDLSMLVRGLVEMLEQLIGEHIELELKLVPGLAPVLADGNAVEQALMNLALNARDAMPEGGRLRFETAQVRVDEAYCRMHSEARAGDHVRVSVLDTGVGMDKATQRHLFEPFFTTKEVGKGTGLGLAMVYGVVKQHDGWIVAESELGVGTRFDVYLPVLKGLAPERTVETEAGFVPTGHETILLAEDEADVRDYSRRALEQLGYDVLVAEDGEEAIEVFRANRDRIQLVVLDVVMPRCSGPKAHRAICELGRTVPALFITGYGAEMAGLSVGAEGGSGRLQKPFTIEQLGQRVRELLDAGRHAL